MAKKTEKTEPAKTITKAAPVKKETKTKDAASAKDSAAKNAPAKAVAAKSNVTVKPKTANKAIEQPVATGFNAVEVYTRFTDFDIFLFKAGLHY